MADIQMRFHRDMLTLSAPVRNLLVRQGVDLDRDEAFINLIEPDTVRDALRMELAAGAQCLVANTAAMSPARLAYQSMEDRGEELATAALAVANALRPQHAIVELEPTGLPFDPSSDASLKEHKGQYARSARWFEKGTFDAFLLNGFSRGEELKCALMGVSQVSARPIFASVLVDAEGIAARGETLEQLAALAREYGASVFGFETAEPPDAACALVRRAAAASDMPVLVQLKVAKTSGKRQPAAQGAPYGCADVLADAALRLREAGAQFLRATGDATPAFTGALAVTTSGADVLRSDIEAG